MGLLKNSRGATTVFLLIIFMALLILTGVLIDAGRIMTAKNRVQSALDSAVRSTMAGYHQNLVGEFGLYGVLIKPEDTSKYFSVNLEERHKNIKFIEYTVKNVDVEFNTSLLNNDSFKKQVLQYMQYKAPLTGVKQLLDIFSDNRLEKGSGLMTTGCNTINLRAKLETVFKDLNTDIRGIASSLARGAFERSTEAVFDLINDIEKADKSLETKLNEELAQYEDAVAELNSISEDIEGKSIPETEALHTSINELRTKISNNVRILRRIAALLAQVHEIENDKTLSNTERESKIDSLKDEIKSLGNSLEKIDEIVLDSPEIGSIRQDNLNVVEKAKEKIKNMLLKEITPDELIDRETVAMANNPEKEFELQEKGYYRLNEEFAVLEGEKIASFLSELSQKLKKLALEGRDSIYIAEYVVDKYTYVTSATPRDHYFKKGEVEYILSGNNLEITNLLDICGRIWFLRFSVNTMYSFITSKNPYPLARLGYSLIDGFARACFDVKSLYEGKGVSLIPDNNGFKGVKLKYSDYLLLFLLLQDEETQLNRMRDLIQINIKKVKNEPDFKLEQCHTICQAKAEVEINLWFVPALHPEKLGWKSFRNNKYLIVRESVFGY